MDLFDCLSLAEEFIGPVTFTDYDESLTLHVNEDGIYTITDNFSGYVKNTNDDPWLVNVDWTKL